MLIRPDLADDSIVACLNESYGLRIARITFLPIGDVNSAVYRVEAADGTPYFLKLRRGGFDEVAVAVPAWLRAQGIRQVMAPITTTAGRLWVFAHGCAWVLYPFLAGENGFRVPLARAQWIALGEGVAAVHAAILPAELGRRVPREEYAPRWRDRVRSYQEQVAAHAFDDDEIARRFAALWTTKRDEIASLVKRAEELGDALQHQRGAVVLCHTDLHAGNVLVGADGELTIVDWDDPLLASKERDLMFIGAGIGGIWNHDEEAALFYQGYGPTDIDLVALSYYRYERIVADLAAFGDEIFGHKASDDDRALGVRKVTSAFDPNDVVEIAHRTYAELRGLSVATDGRTASYPRD